MTNKPSIDPQNISMWIVASVCIGLLALLLGAVVLMEHRNTAMKIEQQIMILNQKIENISKLNQGAAAPPSSAPTQPAGQPAK